MPKSGRPQYCYDYPRPCVTVDVVIFTVKQGDLKVLLIRRGREPFKDRWAIPGGFVEMDETLEQGAVRELEEETGVKGVFLEQLATFGDPRRDPRGRTITVAYYALVKASRLKPRAADDAAATRWFSMNALPPLAFDHDKILACALERLRAQLVQGTAGAYFLPRTFTIEQLQHLHQTVMGTAVPRGKLRSQMLGQDLIVELKSTGSRSAPRYRFVRR
jgi:8-oxo-dGTP diphosphatase